MNTLSDFFEVIEQNDLDEYGHINDLILIQLFSEIDYRNFDTSIIKKIFSDKFFTFNNSFIIDTQIKSLIFLETDELKKIFLNLENNKSLFLKRGLITFYCNAFLDKATPIQLKDFFLEKIFNNFNFSSSNFIKTYSLKILTQLVIYHNDSNIEKIFKEVSKEKKDYVKITILSEISKNLTYIIKNNKINLFNDLIEEYSKDENSLVKVYLSIVITKIIISNENNEDIESIKKQLISIFKSISNKTWIKILIKKQILELIDISKIKSDYKEELRKIVNGNILLKKKESIQRKNYQNQSNKNNYITLEKLSDKSIIRILKRASLSDVVNQDIDNYDKDKMNKKIQKYKSLNTIITNKLFFNTKFKNHIENYSIKYSNPFYCRDNEWFSFDQETENESIITQH